MARSLARSLCGSRGVSRAVALWPCAQILAVLLVLVRTAGLVLQWRLYFCPAPPTSPPPPPQATPSAQGGDAAAEAEAADGAADKLAGSVPEALAAHLPGGAQAARAVLRGVEAAMGMAAPVVSAAVTQAQAEEREEREEQEKRAAAGGGEHEAALAGSSSGTLSP